MLQLFIMTGGRAMLNYSQAFLNNIPEPLPQGQSNSMMVRSELIFKEVLPQSLRNNGWALQGVNPGSTTKAWSGKFTGASVIGTVDLSKLNHTSSNGGGQGGGSFTEYTYSIPGGKDVSWSLVDTTITAQANGQMYYSGSRGQSLQYNQHSCTTVYPCFWSCTSCRDSMLATHVMIEVRASLPLGVGGSGRNQISRSRLPVRASLSAATCPEGVPGVPMTWRRKSISRSRVRCRSRSRKTVDPV